MLQFTIPLVAFVVLGIWIALYYCCNRMAVSSANNSDAVSIETRITTPVHAMWHPPLNTNPLPEMELIQINQSAGAQEEMMYIYPWICTFTQDLYKCINVQMYKSSVSDAPRGIYNSLASNESRSIKSTSFRVDRSPDPSLASD